MTKPKKASQYKPSEYAQAITEAQGLISVAARRLGVSRSAVYNAVNRHKRVAEALEDTRERTTDLAEGKLYGKINDGDITAIIFYLKTQGKARGYIERQERVHSGSIDVTRLTDEQLEALATGQGLDSG